MTRREQELESWDDDDDEDEVPFHHAATTTPQGGQYTGRQGSMLSPRNLSNLVVESALGKEKGKRELRSQASDLLMERKKSDGASLWKRGKMKITLGHVLDTVRKESCVADDIMIADLIASMPILSSSSRELVSKLAAGSLSTPYKDDEVIVRQGASGGSLLLVVRGVVDILIGDQVISELTSGQYFGETNLIGLELQWAVTLRARSRCHLCEIKREHLLQSLEAFPRDKRYFENLRARNEACMLDGTLVKTCKVLQGLSERTLQVVDLHLVRRLYFPGEKLLVEGQMGSELYILVQGRANVEMAGRVVRSEQACANVHGGEEEAAVEAGEEQNGQEVFKSYDPVCFGELGFFGLQEHRSASVVAQTVCQVRILYRSMFLKTLQEHGESLRLEELSAVLKDRYKSQIEAPMNKLRLREIKFFEESCSDEFLMFLASNLEDRIFLSGQTVLPVENSLYILSEGTLDVLKNGIRVTSQSDGSVLGEIIALGMGSKEPGTTYEATETCFISVLHQTVIIRALELFPADRQKVLLMTFNRDEDDEAEEARIEDAEKKYISTARRGTGGPRKSMRAAQKKLEADNADTDKDAQHQKEWKAKTHKAFMRAMQNSQLFTNVGVAFLDHLASVSMDRIYMPGDLIIEEGKRGDSMFIMVSGQAGVFAREVDNSGGWNLDIAITGTSPKVGANISKTTRIGFLSPGSISGELAMLGVSQYRSATIKAETLCSMWEITQENALSILSAFPEANRQFTNIVLNRLERTAPSRVLHLNIFKEFDRKFRMLVGLYCEKRAYFPGQHVVKEGCNADGMYVVNMGRATLEKCSVTIKTYTPGMFFCSTVMLGVHKKSLGTMISLQTCHILVITHTSFGLALEKYPCHQVYQELKSHEIEEYNEFLKATQRIAARKLVWRRYQKFMATSLQNDGKSEEEQKVSERAMLMNSLQVWRRFAVHSSKNRSRIVLRKQKAEEWVQRQREAREKRRHQEAEQRMARHASERGCSERYGLSEMHKHRGTDSSDGEICQSRSQSPREGPLSPEGEVLSPPSLPKVASPLHRVATTWSGPANLCPNVSPFSPLVAKRMARQSRPHGHSARLPALRKDLAGDGYGSDADYTPRDSARGPQSNAFALTDGAGMYAGGYPYPSSGPVKLSDKQCFMRGLPFSLDQAGDLPGCNHKMFSLLAGGQKGGATESSTQIFWQGVGV